VTPSSSERSNRTKAMDVDPGRQGAPDPRRAPPEPSAPAPRWAPPPGSGPVQRQQGPPPGGGWGQPPAPGWGAPPPPRRAPRVSGLAIIALVTAVAGLFVPVVLTLTGLILAVAAARAIRRSGGSLTGRGMATTAGIVAGFVLIINAVTISAIVRNWDAVSRGFDGAGEAFRVTRGLAEGRVVEWTALKEGDCFLFPLPGDDTLVERVDCATPHDGEAYAVVPIGGSSYPGQAAVEDQVATACDERFSAYVGVPLADSDLDSRFVVPDEVAWDVNGVRSGLCMIVPPEGSGRRLSGSGRGTG
jgi:Septum formation